MRLTPRPYRRSREALRIARAGGACRRATLRSVRRPSGPPSSPDPPPGTPGTGPARRPRRRDRHGRGIRGALAPSSVPLAQTRAETFDDLVLDAVDQVELTVRQDPALADRVAAVELGVEDVPPE